MNLTGASGKRKSLAEQQKLIEEALRAAEGAHREELEKQRLALEQKIQEAHAQYERAKSMAQLTKQGHVYIISNIGSFGENVGNDSNLLIVFYVQIMPDDFVMQLHRF
ncbi:Chromosome segregation ATPase from phage origin, putative coiled-coil [Escherichia coli]|nr:Chromosome segregation ATPase from phage origin, putative coiled-coil [Escherichia coli]